MALPVTFATLPAGNAALSLLDTQFAAVAALGYIPCAAGAGPSAITLTPFAGSPAVLSYTDLAPGFIFAAAASSTGGVTLNVAGLGARNAYKWNAAVDLFNLAGPFPVGANDIVTGGIYRAAFLTALNSGAGGFVVDCLGIANQLSAIEFIIDGGGSPITAGVKGQLFIPFPCLVANWSVIGDQSGTISIDILRANNAVPVTSIVGGGTKPNLTAQQLNAGVTPAGWTSVALSVNDFVAFQVTGAPVSVTRVTVVLGLTKT